MNPLRICFITHSVHPVEPRARRMAAALHDAGCQVDVLSLQAPGLPPEEELDGVRVIRLPVSRRQGASAAVYLQEYARFFRLAAGRVRRAGRPRYALVQVFNPPDALIFSTLALKLRGTPIVMDLRELTPELFMSRFGLARGGLAGRLLLLQERLACRYADAVIVLHERHRRIMAGRGVPAAKMTQVMNCPDERFFSPAGLPGAARRAGEGPFTAIYHGGMLERYGVDVLLRAAALARGGIPGLKLALYGTGDHLPALRALAAELDLAGIADFHGHVPLEQVPAALAAADVGVVPMRQDIFTDCVLPTKLLEYVAMGLPAIASRTATTADYFDESMVHLTRPGDAADLAARLLDVYRDPAAAAARALNCRAFTERYNWRLESAAYLHLIETLAHR